MARSTSEEQLDQAIAGVPPQFELYSALGDTCFGCERCIGLTIAANCRLPPRPPADTTGDLMRHRQFIIREEW